jgi:hypothetical protein
MNTEIVMRRIMVRKGDITAIRERIERKLGVESFIEPVPAEYGGGWMIDFYAPSAIDLDFLRPDVLPPKEAK